MVNLNYLGSNNIPQCNLTKIEQFKGDFKQYPLPPIGSNSLATSSLERRHILVPRE
jgi:hypothetical protein